MRRVELTIDEHDELTGVKTMSIVDSPAIESNFVALSKDVQLVELKAPYKQVLAGMALIPDKDIPRIHPKTGEKYMAYFTADGIESIRNKFHKELMTNRVNVGHAQDGYVDAYMVESFIVNSDHRINDVKAMGIKDPVIGSWFIAYKVEDPVVFSKALKGELNGFSAELYVKSLFEKIDNPASTNFDVDAMVNKITDAIRKEQMVLVDGKFKFNGRELVEVIKDIDLKEKSYYEEKLNQLQKRLQ